MYPLYLSLITLFIVALSIIFIPFIKHKKFTSQKFLTIFLLFSLSTLILYFYLNQLNGIKQWKMSGKEHYQLLTEVNQLGGIKTIITRIQQRLKNNPNDIHGWIILSKLFISMNQLSEAKQALDKAQQIEPDNLEVKQIRKSIKKNRASI